MTLPTNACAPPPRPPAPPLLLALALSCGARDAPLLSTTPAIPPARTPCTPDTHQPCYTGPPATRGIGACAPGTQTCLPDGSAFGPCTGETLPAPEDCQSPIDEDCDGVATCTGAVLWQRTLPTYADSLITDAAGNIYLAAWGGAGVDFGDGVVTTGDGLWTVLKLAPDGHALWARVLPYAGSTSGGLTRQLATDGVDVYFAASFDPTGDVIVKLDADGNTLWAKVSPSPTADADTLSLVVEPSGKTLAIAVIPAHAGAFGSSLTEAVSGLLQLDPTGNVVSARAFDAYLIDLAALPLPQGGLAFFGWGAPNAGGAIGCAAPLTGAFVAAFDPPGNCAWFHDHLAVALEGSITADASGVTAVYGSESDLYLNGYGLDGASRFGTSVAGQVIASASSLGPGGLAVVVESSVPMQVGTDVLSGSPDTLAVLRLGPDGSLLWARASNLTSNGVSVASAVDAQGDVLILGTSGAPIDLGAGPLDDGEGSYLVKLAP